MNLRDIAGIAPEKIVHRIVCQVRDDVLCHSQTGQANHSNLEEVRLRSDVASQSKLEWLQYKSAALNDEKAARNDDAMIQTKQ